MQLQALTDLDAAQSALIALLFAGDVDDPVSPQTLRPLRTRPAWAQCRGDALHLTSAGHQVAAGLLLTEPGLRQWNSRVRSSRYGAMQRLEQRLGGRLLADDELIPAVMPTGRPPTLLGGPRCAMRADLALLARGGELLSGEAAEVDPITPRACHAGASLLYLSGQATQIMTGYALIEAAGLWVQHSWGIGSRGQILETTVARDRYFGVRLHAGPDPLGGNGSARAFARQFWE